MYEVIKAEITSYIRKYSFEEIIKRDKTSLNIFWLRDKSLTDLDNLPDPECFGTGNFPLFIPLIKKPLQV